MERKDWMAFMFWRRQGKPFCGLKKKSGRYLTSLLADQI
jgi:hypothetical protein